MPRVLGVDIPGEKRAEFSLRYVYGLGSTRARQVIEEASVRKFFHRTNHLFQA